ncbi:MAG: hypothetical protein GQ545_01525 [Candidatus Aminicenantes bacterium]|nr:hypothetical protein [Candidatus Aminicenantes bacterium]
MKIFLDSQQIDKLTANPKLGWIKTYRYSFLFAAILAQFLLLPLFEKGMNIFIPFMFLLVVVTVLFTLDLRKAVFRACLAVGSLSTILYILARVLHVSPSEQANFVVFALCLDMLFLSFVIYVVLVRIFSEKKVTRDTIKGGISVYFLFGYLCAYVYSLMLLLNPEAISFSMPKVEFSNIIYFSFTTLTTLGYGDITPSTWMARNLTILESSIGQIFIAVLIARLVGQQLAHRSRPVSDSSEDE